MGCYSFCLRAVSTCKEEKAVFVPVFACLVSSFGLPVLLSFHHGRDSKKETAFCGSFLFGWWCLVSPIEQIRTLRAGCRFGLLLLSCLCLSASLLPWGLRYNKDSLYLLRPCGLCSGILLLCFSWCFLLFCAKDSPIVVGRYFGTFR